jgi:alpha-tubulin suppressor-like RCC1 family protein
MLKKEMATDAKFTSIACGYSHMLLLDDQGLIYTFGAGMFGQLGLGPGGTYQNECPMSVFNINYAGDRVTLIACGANYSVCYTESGLLFFWGIRNSDDPSTISWYPSLMGISIPEFLYVNNSQMLFDFHLTCLKASLREILSCDSTGRVYCCQINDSLTLKPYSLQNQIESATNVLVGRNTQIFLEQLLCLAKSKLV